MEWNIPRNNGHVTRLDTYIHIDGLALSYRGYREIVSNASTCPTPVAFVLRIPRGDAVQLSMTQRVERTHRPRDFRTFRGFSEPDHAVLACDGRNRSMQSQFRPHGSGKLARKIYGRVLSPSHYVAPHFTPQLRVNPTGIGLA